LETIKEKEGTEREKDRESERQTLGKTDRKKTFLHYVQIIFYSIVFMHEMPTLVCLEAKKC
jgi:hypothetical protein